MIFIVFHGISGNFREFYRILEFLSVFKRILGFLVYFREF